MSGRAGPDGLWYEEGRFCGATRIHLSSGVSALEMLRIETDEAKESSQHDLDLYILRGLKGRLHHPQQHPSPYTPAFLPWLTGGRDHSR